MPTALEPAPRDLRSRSISIFDLYSSVNEIRLDPDYVAIRHGNRSAARAGAIRLAAFARNCLYAILSSRDVIAWLKLIEPRPVVLFSSTSNQTLALTRLAGELAGPRWLLTNQVTFEADPRPLKVPAILVQGIALATLPITLLFILRFCLTTTSGSSVKQRWRAVAFSFDEIARTLGYVAVAKWMLRRLKCRKMVMSNDHNSINRAICLACRYGGVKTFYVQHAPIAPLFPTLLFDVALVDGEHAASIYLRKCPAANILVTGAGRYERWRQRSPLADIGRRPIISLAMNKVDDRDIFVAYHQHLRALGMTVFVRPHPGMSAAELDFLPADARIDRSAIQCHLEKVDILIAGSSGILLDAFMDGVVPMAATDLSTAGDYYGFLRHRAVAECTLASVAAVLGDLRSLDMGELRRGMSYYNAALSSLDKSSPAARQADLVMTD